MRAMLIASASMLLLGVAIGYLSIYGRPVCVGSGAKAVAGQSVPANGSIKRLLGLCRAH